MRKKKDRSDSEAHETPAADDTAATGAGIPDESGPDGSVPGGAPAADTSSDVPVDAPAGSPVGASSDTVTTEENGAAAAESAAEPLPEPSPEELLQKERDEYHDRWLRSVAELDNYRKRTRREVADARRFTLADLLRSLLEVIDNFERALTSLSEENEAERDLAGFQAGVAMIYQRFQEILLAQGLNRIEALDQEFDPNLHEAIQQVEKEGVPAGRIIDVLQTGYLLDDLVLRPSRVVIAK